MSTTVANVDKSQGKSEEEKRLHVSNIPFKYRESDLRDMFGVSSCVTFMVFDLYLSGKVNLLNIPIKFINGSVIQVILYNYFYYEIKRLQFEVYF